MMTGEYSKYELDLYYLWRSSPCPLVDILSRYIRSHNAKYPFEPLRVIYVAHDLVEPIKEQLTQNIRRLRGPHFDMKMITYYEIEGCRLIGTFISEESRQDKPNISYVFWRKPDGGLYTI